MHMQVMTINPYPKMQTPSKYILATKKLTLGTTSVLAPLVRRISTASILPLLTASHNGVLFLYIV